MGGVPSPPVYTRVCTEGRLTLEFTYDDMMRIRTWHLAVRQHRELVPRSSAAAAVAAIVMIQQQGPGNDSGPSSGTQPPNAEIVHQQVAKNITRQGITNSTLNYLRVSNKYYCDTNHNKIKFINIPPTNHLINKKHFKQYIA